MVEAMQQTFSVRFDENNQEFSIIGSMRPQRVEDLAGCSSLFQQSLRSVRGTLYVKDRARLEAFAGFNPDYLYGEGGLRVGGELTVKAGAR